MPRSSIDSDLNAVPLKVLGTVTEPGTLTQNHPAFFVRSLSPSCSCYRTAMWHSSNVRIARNRAYHVAWTKPARQAAPVVPLSSGCGRQKTRTTKQRKSQLLRGLWSKTAVDTGLHFLSELFAQQANDALPKLGHFTSTTAACSMSTFTTAGKQPDCF